MKKSLFALAVLGAFSGMAAAQSSVTLFGIVDANVRYTKNGDNKALKELGNSGLASSRLGFRGVEDLGGGLKAGFWLESAINNDDGTSNSSRFWHRRSTVSLMGDFGEVRLGRDLLPTFTGYADFDAFGTNGVGDVNRLHSVLRSGADTQIRGDNAISYFLPSNLGGFNGQVTVAAGEGATGKKYVGGRLGYAAGPLAVAGFYGQTEITDDDLKVGGVSASYDFGAFKLTGNYTREKYTSRKADIYSIGGSVPVGAGLIRASYTHVKGDNAYAGDTDGKSNQFAIGYVHNLSKRTAIYTTYAIIKNKDAAGYTVSSTSVGSAVDAKSQGFELGIRHAF